MGVPVRCGSAGFLDRSDRSLCIGVVIRLGVVIHVEVRGHSCGGQGSGPIIRVGVRGHSCGGGHSHSMMQVGHCESEERPYEVVL